MKLVDVRDQIDTIDEQLVDLLAERARLAQIAFKIKQKDGQVSPFVPEREDRVFGRTTVISQAKLGASTLGIFSEIVSMCRYLEKTIEIFILQSQKCSAEAAVVKRFGQYVDLYIASNVNKLITELKTGPSFGFIVKDSLEYNEISNYSGMSIVCEYNYKSLLPNASDIQYALVQFI